MKRYILLISGLLAFLCINGQGIITNSSVTGVCYAGNKIKKIFIPPPHEFYAVKGSKGGGEIIVHSAGFSTQGKIAVEYAASIMASLLPAGTRVVLSATWEKVSTPGVLGYSSIAGFAGGWGIDAIYPYAFYPVSLAEKIAGKSLNGESDADITLTINSNINWYLGTDGNTPEIKYDLVTVVLHEMCHGLGFFDSMDTDESTGWYGIGSMPFVYDKFVENLAEQNLTDSLIFKNNSSALRSQLTGGNLYFSGPLLRQYSTGSRARLYVPSRWDSGSSVSHLDEELTDSVNALMTPFIDFGEAIHDPGGYTMSILGDIGWVNTRIIHSPQKDSEEHLSNIPLSIRIESDTIYDHSKVGLVYSFDNFTSIDTLYLTSEFSDDNYSLNLQLPSYNTKIQYYFFAEDCFSRLYRSPSNYDTAMYQAYIGTDTIKPVIVHAPAEYYFEIIDSIEINALATDNIGLDSVYIEFRKNSGATQYLRLGRYPENVFKTVLTKRILNLNGGDSLSYRIFAVDTSLNANIAVLPDSGYFNVRIEEIKSVVTSYATDFAASQGDFFVDGFEIRKPDGFSSLGLHTKHPYESPVENGLTIEYTAMLRYPIKYNESGLMISFNEIVLVEPGEPGSVFGNEDFYDYVITEASADDGGSWFPLSDGYDSRAGLDWEMAYKSAINGDNSAYVPTQAMMKERKIFYRSGEHFSYGDALLLRFRLFSDPLANGWGWVIDDLKINLLIDEIEKISSEPVTLYPNPGSGLIKFNTRYSEVKAFRMSIFNSSGVCIRKYQADEYEQADISDQPSGLYFVVLYYDDKVTTFKYNLVK